MEIEKYTPNSLSVSAILGLIGGHLFAIAADKSVEYRYDGFLYGFAANKDLLE